MKETRSNNSAKFGLFFVSTPSSFSLCYLPCLSSDSKPGLLKESWLYVLSKSKVGPSDPTVSLAKMNLPNQLLASCSECKGRESVGAPKNWEEIDSKAEWKFSKPAKV
jgi:hypothetical protein